MEKMALKEGAQNYEQDAAWYRALTLSERSALLHMGAYEQSGAAVAGDETAEQRLRMWKGQNPFNKDSYFEQRLALDGLSEDDLFALLAEPAEDLRARVPAPPAWMAELSEALEEWDSGDSTLMLQATNASVQSNACFIILRPLIERAAKRLRAGIEELANKYPRLPFDPATIVSLLLPALMPPLSLRFLRTFVLELNVARVQGRLQGDTPEERFQHFVQHLSRREGILELLEEYPVLARRLVETIDRWAACSLELLTRLCADWDEISVAFFAGANPGTLVEIEAGKGDMHQGGRSVTILRWSSGARLVYKPHSLAIDAHFQELLAWLNRRGFRPELRTFKVIDRGDYGWVEFVEARPCTSREEIERFYRRQGGYLALLYALEAMDVHAENLIASGEHPMLIDLETLLQPQVAMPTAVKQRFPGLEIMDHSVMRVGLLPQRLWGDGRMEGIDISGLGGESGQLTSKPVAKVTASGTDRMRIIRERASLNLGGLHRPKLQDQDVNTQDYCDSIIAGFTAAYHLLLQHRDELLAEILPRLAHDEIRRMLRSTATYTLIYLDSFHPNVLRDALDRDRLLDRLWVGIEQQPYFARLIPAELADLQSGDIPVFKTTPASLDLFASDGSLITGFLAEPGLEVVSKRIRQLDEEDLAKQIWIIRASFAAMALGIDKVGQPLLRLQPLQSEMQPERLIAGAQAVGDRLHRLALHVEGTVGWLGLTPTNEREWHLLPADADLYSGTAGMALFLAYLGAVTGEERHTELAKLALATVRHQVAPLKEHPNQANIGLFSGISSFIYLLAHLGTLWNDEALYREAEEIVTLLPAAIEQDQAFDVMAGTAGCLAALLALHAVAPSQTTLAMTIRCGDHLVSCARPMSRGLGWSTKMAEIPLAGISHGNAGIALSLLRLYASCGDDRYQRTALEAMEYERSLFSVERRNWPDLRSPSSGQPQPAPEQAACMVAWCHGAPGMALARLGSLPFVDDAAIGGEIEAALATTLAEGFGWNHSLCHGDMGNIDALLVAARTLRDPRYEKQIRRIVPMLLDSIDRQGWVLGVPQGIETPGLMTGLTGAGYELLRLAAPNRVPSILALEPPIRMDA
jgi:type 2 lantibiotic biosynthesis protein LanM